MNNKVGKQQLNQMSERRKQDIKELTFIKGVCVPSSTVGILHIQIT